MYENSLIITKWDHKAEMRKIIKMQSISIFIVTLIIFPWINVPCKPYSLTKLIYTSPPTSRNTETNTSELEYINYPVHDMLTVLGDEDLIIVANHEIIINPKTTEPLKNPFSILFNPNIIFGILLIALISLIYIQMRRKIEF